MSGERHAVVSAIETVGATPVWFENFGGMEDDPEDAYLGQVASSGIYLGALGARYGRPLKSGYSATHAKYNAAIDAGLRISVWTAADGLDGPQRDVLDAVRVFRTTDTYAPCRRLAGSSGRPAKDHRQRGFVAVDQDRAGARADH